MAYGEIYNTTWWGVALDTARTVKARPDFFGSQLNLLTSEQPNLVVNGTFDTDSDWVKQNGWSIENGLAIFSGTVSAYRKLYQENILTIGKIYKLTFDIVSINSGSIKNFSQSSPTSYSTIGTKTEYFTATFDNLFLEPTNNANLTIDNVSVKEINGNTGILS